jgi:acyl carrier protein|tara:strand:- start:251 stop:490 length:240 start_codon:yes stop_codon:yes gene_type:complete
MKRQEIFKRVSLIFREVLEDDSLNINEKDGANDIEDWDSLTHIMLIVETEKEFNIKFISSEISNWDNIGDMITAIENKL